MAPPLRYQVVHSSLRLHTDPVSCVSTSPSGKFIATGTDDGRLFLSTLEDGGLFVVVLTRAPVKSLMWYPMNVDSLAFGCSTGILGTIVLSSDVLIAHYQQVDSHKIGSVSINGCGSMLASGSGNDIRLWTPSNHSQGHWALNKRLVLQADGPLIPEVCSFHWYHPGSNVEDLVVAYKHHGVRIWDAHSGDLLRTICQSEYIGSSALSSNKQYLAVARQFVFQIYDLDSGMIVRTFKHKLGATTSKLPVEFAHGDLALLCIYDHGSVRLWDLTNQVKMQTLSLDGGQICSVSVYDNPSHAQGFYIVVGGKTCVQVWKTARAVGSTGRNQWERGRIVFWATAVGILITALCLWWQPPLLRYAEDVARAVQQYTV